MVIHKVFLYKILVIFIVDFKRVNMVKQQGNQVLPISYNCIYVKISV